MIGVKPEECRQDLIERVRDMQERGIEICGAETGNRYYRWRCGSPVMSGSRHCWHHTPKSERWPKRINDSDIRLAAEMFARGATGKEVGDELGIKPFQAYRLKKLQSFPKVRVSRPDPPPPIDLEIVGIMKTEENEWTTLYG